MPHTTQFAIDCDFLRQWMDLWVSSDSFPNLAVSIFKKDKEIFHHVAGYQNAAQRQALQRDTIYRIYSMTKPVTSVGMLMLIDRGLVQLDDPVHKYIPSFAQQKVIVGGTPDEPVLEPVQSPMTVRHLLTQTSGLSYGLFGTSLADKCLQKAFGPHIKSWYATCTLEEFCDTLGGIPISFHPGTAFLYGLNTDVIGRIIEIVSGQSLRDYLLTELLGPLGMTDTDFYVPPEKLHRLSEVYEVTVGHHYAVSVNAERQRETLHAMLAGGGGLNSTLADYGKFISFLLSKCKLADGRALVSEYWHGEMTKNQLPNNADITHFAFEKSGFSESLGEGIGFGYGVSVVIDTSRCRGGEHCALGEYGWGGVASTWFAVNPTNQSAIVLMCQLIPSSVYPIRHQLRTIFNKIAYGCPEEEPQPLE